jgi:prepilin-type N-terminal cleavage/methylation domain-containing protein
MNTVRSDNHNNHGFTIVELLIVIVVIGILAAITIVAYNGISVRAANTSRMAELRQWEKLLRLYYAQNGSYPVPSAGFVGNYCLGTGFPSQNEVNLYAGVNDKATSNNPDGYCRDIYLAGTRHEADAVVNSALRSVGSLPGTENHKKLVSWSTSVGPWYTYGGSPSISGVFAGSTCPENTISGYTYNPGQGSVEATICIIQLP